MRLPTELVCTYSYRYNTILATLSARWGDEMGVGYLSRLVYTEFVAVVKTSWKQLIHTDCKVAMYILVLVLAAIHDRQISSVMTPH